MADRALMPTVFTALGALVAAHRRARLGFASVPQGRDIFTRLTVAENLMLGALPWEGIDLLVENVDAQPGARITATLSARASPLRSATKLRSILSAAIGKRCR